MTGAKTHFDYQNLVSKIQKHNFQYHVLDDPLISDYEFDQLLIRLREIEGEHPEWILPDSPSQRSGADPAKRFEKITHPVPILSLSNAFSNDDIYKWYARIEKIDERVNKATFVLEPKIDGLTVVLHYRNGLFIDGATRGNGEIGEDISQNLKTIPSIPLRVPINKATESPQGDLYVRAEAFITKKDFQELNDRSIRKGQNAYQNPRNTAAGTLRLLDPTQVAERPIRILAYSIIRGISLLSQWEALEKLGSLGFPTSKYNKKFKTIDEVIASLKEWEALREKIPYEIDGVVIKVNELEITKSLGFVGKDPRGAIALKFPAQEVSTTLQDIGINIGRTGIVTPYARLKPVEIGGVVVQQATLHNFDFIAERDIRIGDRVLIKRAGDVIPYVIGPIKSARRGDERKYQIPNTCPVCGQSLQTEPGEVAWYCKNKKCPARTIRSIEHYVSKSGMNIVGLGINIIDRLVKETIILDAADLYYLTKEDLIDLEGFGEKKVDNILRSISASKSNSLSKLINALGINGVGESAAEQLAKKFKSLDAVQKATEEHLMAINGFGESITQSVKTWFGYEENRLLLEKLKKANVWPIVTNSEMNDIDGLAGLTFVVTGTLKAFTRTEIKENIKKHGGKVSDSISRKTDYLVVGKNPGSKYTEAKLNKIPIISERELMNMMDSK